METEARVVALEKQLRVLKRVLFAGVLGLVAVVSMAARPQQAVGLVCGSLDVTKGGKAVTSLDNKGNATFGGDVVIGGNLKVTGKGSVAGDFDVGKEVKDLQDAIKNLPKPPAAKELKAMRLPVDIELNPRVNNVQPAAGMVGNRFKLLTADNAALPPYYLNPLPKGATVVTAWYTFQQDFPAFRELVAIDVYPDRGNQIAIRPVSPKKAPGQELWITLHILYYE